MSNLAVRAVRERAVDAVADAPDRSIIIGKDVLELLTAAMYVDPLTIFREYIQNAADAIDDAIKRNLFTESSPPRVDIVLDSSSRSIRVRDNGIGIPTADFWPRMTALGASRKRGAEQRGFRGVGRLSGLGYAQEVIFRSRALGDSVISEIVWDGRKLRELLRDGGYDSDVTAAIRDVTRPSTREASCEPDHFFEVELRRVARIKNDLLLNPDEVRRYVAQVGPVPFAPTFEFGLQIESFLEHHGINPGLHVQISGDPTPIYRQFANDIHLNERLSDRFSSVEFLEVPGNDRQVDAVAWVLHHSYLGALSRSGNISGIRVRSGNIQVGGHNILETLFSEPRFNSWCVGDFHILTSRIVPNGRRDDFEVNAHYQNFHSHASALAHRLSKLCRDRSIQRNRLRNAEFLTQVAHEQLAVLRDRSAPALVRQHYRDLIVSTINQLRRMSKDSKFKTEEQSLIVARADAIENALQKAPALRASQNALTFLPARKRRMFFETLKLAIGACDTPEQAARLARKVFDRARRKKF